MDLMTGEWVPVDPTLPLRTNVGELVWDRRGGDDPEGEAARLCGGGFPSGEEGR